jgi:hypothetical protein
MGTQVKQVLDSKRSELDSTPASTLNKKAGPVSYNRFGFLFFNCSAFTARAVHQTPIVKIIALFDLSN